jgi:hypothetical protein
MRLFRIPPYGIGSARLGKPSLRYKINLTAPLESVNTSTKLAEMEPEPIGCWAKCLGNCSQKMSREHTISKGLFNDDEIMVQGFPWCLNAPKRIGLSNFVAKILCKAHNSKLSELDDAAKAAFAVFRESVRLNNVRQKLKRPTIWNVKRLEIDGPRLERWFLKTLINLSFGGQWTIGVGSHVPGSVARDLV